MVPIRPTSQLGNRPAHRKPGGIQWMALLRSAMPLRTERSSPRICLWSWERLQEENMVYHVLLHHITMSHSATILLYINCKQNCGYNTCGPLRHSHISSASSSVTSELGVIWRAKIHMTLQLWRCLVAICFIFKYGNSYKVYNNINTIYLVYFQGTAGIIILFLLSSNPMKRPNNQTTNNELLCLSKSLIYLHPHW